MTLDNLQLKFPNSLFGFEYIKDKTIYYKTLKTRFDDLLSDVDLDPIFVDKSGSLVCIWHNDSQNKLVWIDSEGMPCSVFAEHLDDFFEILPYGPNLIWDYLSKYDNHFMSPHLIPHPSTVFTLPYLTETYLNTIEDQNVFNAYCNWLNENNLSFNTNPIKKMNAAVNSSDFLNWFTN